jgi:hypothetical protein
MVIEIVTANWPKLPESRQLTSPPSPVWLSAWLKVAQGDAAAPQLTTSIPLCEIRV